MRALVFLMISILCFSACSKQDDNSQDLNMNKPIAKNAITVNSFSGKWEGSTVHLQFQISGDFSKVSEFQVLSGSSNTQLCLIGVLSVQSNSSDTESFSFIDTHPKSSPVYYMIGIKNLDGTVTYLNNIVSVSDN